jgi:hypothetical protein
LRLQLKGVFRSPLVALLGDCENAIIVGFSGFTKVKYNARQLVSRGSDGFRGAEFCAHTAVEADSLFCRA